MIIGSAHIWWLYPIFWYSMDADDSTCIQVFFYWWTTSMLLRLPKMSGCSQWYGRGRTSFKATCIADRFSRLERGMRQVSKTGMIFYFFYSYFWLWKFAWSSPFGGKFLFVFRLCVNAWAITFTQIFSTHLPVILSIYFVWLLATLLDSILLLNVPWLFSLFHCHRGCWFFCILLGRTIM